jgi:hypothetical protein
MAESGSESLLRRDLANPTVAFVQTPICSEIWQQASPAATLKGTLTLQRHPVLRFLQLRSWSLAGLLPPWEGQPLYELVRAHGANAELPEPQERGENQFGWAPGALDGVTGHHFSRPESSQIRERSSEILRALEELLRRASRENLSKLHALTRKEVLLPVADEVQKEIATELLNRPKYKARIAEVGRYLMTRAVDRETTKFGILLMELSAESSDRNVLETLAGHDEFTLYAALALFPLTADPEITLWEIAKRVHGWGRVQVVERLKRTQNQEIRAWMLREGFRNHIMDGYLAGLCARTGVLHDALKPAEIDRALLDGAAGIIKALVLRGGPADFIDDYPEAPDALREYLGHAQRTTGLTLEHLLCIASLHRFLAQEDGWEDRFSEGWAEENRDLMRSVCAELMKRPEWIEEIHQALQSTDPEVFYQGDVAAQELGIDTRAIHFARVRSEPLKPSSWNRLLQQTKEDQLDEVLSFAEQALPLDQIAIGPADLLGLGDKYAAHQALDCILQNLKRFPERGWKFLQAGLQSPVTRNRNLALTAILAWPKASWPGSARELLRKAYAAEPNAKLRERLGSALSE